MAGRSLGLTTPIADAGCGLEARPNKGVCGVIARKTAPAGMVRGVFSLGRTMDATIGALGGAAVSWLAELRFASGGDPSCN